MKPVYWVGSCLKDLRDFPEVVQRDIGYALHFAQVGVKHKNSKPMKGMDGVMEIVSDFNTDTYRAVYAVKIDDMIYVLHIFQKKSKHGIATPKEEINVINRRL